MRLFIFAGSSHIKNALKEVLTSLGCNDTVFLNPNDNPPTVLKEEVNDLFLQNSVIFVEINDQDLNGIELYRELGKDSSFRNVPAIALVHSTVKDHIICTAFEEGFFDLLAYPFQKREIQARLHASTRLNREREARVSCEKDIISLTEGAEKRGLQYSHNVDLLKDVSGVDDLTGILNHASFLKLLDKEWKTATRFSRPVSLVLAALDFFRIFNETYGSDKGDRCLKDVAMAMKRAIKRPGDVVARYGGDQFAIILPETSHEGAYHMADIIRSSVKSLEIKNNRSPISNFLTVSIGVASVMITTGSDMESLVNTANRALHQAKTEGRNRIC